MRFHLLVCRLFFFYLRRWIKTPKRNQLLYVIYVCVTGRYSLKKGRRYQNTAKWDSLEQKNQSELKTINKIYGGMEGASLNHTLWMKTSASTHLSPGSSEERSHFFLLFSARCNRQVTREAVRARDTHGWGQASRSHRLLMCAGVDQYNEQSR